MKADKIVQRMIDIATLMEENKVSYKEIKALSRFIDFVEIMDR